MDRFTERFKDGRNILRKGISDIFYIGFGRFFDGDAVDRLAEYEDLQEQGRLLKLPCAVGDKIYYFDRTCNGNHMDCLEKPCEKCKDYQFEVYEGKFTLEDYEDFGKWLFSTRKEAELKLKELSNKES